MTHGRYAIGTAHAVEYSWYCNHDDIRMTIVQHRSRADTRQCMGLVENESYWLVMPQNAWTIDDIPREPVEPPTWEELFG